MSWKQTFVAVLRLDLLKEYSLRTQRTHGGYVLALPPFRGFADELVIYKDGCCMSNGQTKIARSGYGIYFPQLWQDRDFGTMLPKQERHSNHRVDLIVVILALQVLAEGYSATISAFSWIQYAPSKTCRDGYPGGERTVIV